MNEKYNKIPSLFYIRLTIQSHLSVSAFCQDTHPSTKPCVFWDNFFYI